MNVALIICALLLAFKLTPTLAQVSLTSRGAIVVDAGLDDIAKTLAHTSPRLAQQIINENDLQNGYILDEMSNYKKAVARITVPATESTEAKNATGFLISNSLLMTNNHVIGSVAEARGATADFNYELAPPPPSPGNPKPVDAYTINASNCYTNKDLDYTIVKLNSKQKMGNLYKPGEVWSFIPLADSAQAGKGNKTSILQHPDGSYTQFTWNDGIVQYTTPKGFVAYTSDTLRGSSGSPVFNNKAQLIALHHYEGEEDPISGSVSNNEGILIGKIIQDLKSKLSTNAEGRKLLVEMALNSSTSLNKGTGVDTIMRCPKTPPPPE